jgi:PPOX class probable F420-dependent enzyme
MALRSLPEPGTRFGDRLRRRLGEEMVAWLTTVGADGTPQPNPVWFLWDGESLLVYNRPDAHRLAHVRSRPRVSLHFDSNGGGDIAVLTGSAEIADEEPAPHQQAEYVDKYRDRMIRVSGDLEEFSRQYPVPLRIRELGARGW